MNAVILCYFIPTNYSSHLKMYTGVLPRTLQKLAHMLAVQKTHLHIDTTCLAAKKTTSAAGGVMGLGKGKKKMGKLGAMEKKEMPVETDPNKLVNYVCGSNIYVTGEDVKLKDDSEYPEWLWTLRTTGPPQLEELDPNTKQYWLRVRAAGIRRNNKLRSMRNF